MDRRGFLIVASAPLVAVPASALAKLDGVATPFPGVSVCTAPDVAPPIDTVELLNRYWGFVIGETINISQEMDKLGFDWMTAGRFDNPASRKGSDAAVDLKSPPSTRALQILSMAGVRL
jgi:hypothetical protein